jgi:ribonucleoside-diphosphate reductase alpha chain
MTDFNVIKRSGEVVPIQFDEISRRNEQLVQQLGIHVNVAKLTQTVIQGLKNNITTQEIDHLSCETAISLSVYEPDYDKLAARIFMNNLQKSTPHTFGEAFTILFETGLIHDDVFSFFQAHKDQIHAAICDERDYQYNYFACKTLERGYLLKNKNKTIVERPQYMIMRVALGIHHRGSIINALETYEAMSQLWFTHASPTLFNGGTTFSQLSSCFLLGMDDSLDSIYTTLHHSAMISKHGGGIGINISNVRSKGSRIESTNGSSDGIIPMIRVFNETARYVNQSGKRKGSIAMYVEPWHPEILDFLSLRLNNGTEETRARDIFTALWIPDLFMKRVQTNGEWTLFDPNAIKKQFGKGLQDVYGEEFNAMYTKSEEIIPGVKVKARDIWIRAMESQMETGTPYLLYKDSVNYKSNQSNIGIIRGSNLCAEILEYTDGQHISVCNLASVALNKCVTGTESGEKRFDYEQLGKIMRIMVRNLNQIIDTNYYPVDKARKTNLSHRPIGMGVQGLHDVFCLLGLNWDSDEARDVNRRIFETMYYYATDESAALSREFGSYEFFTGSPISKGILQPDMWGVKPVTDLDWDGLRQRVTKGMRNSLLLSLMPTASTSQLLGNTEAFEPVTSNLYTRKVLAGDFPVINQHLYQELHNRGLWTKSVVNDIIRNNGSIQELDVPVEIKKRFRTVWELSMKTIITLAADRAPFIDQTQSMNLFVASPTLSNLSSMHMFAWEKGLKTGCYYLRSKPKTEAVKFTLMEDSVMKRFESKKESEIEEVCTSCSA